MITSGDHKSNKYFNKYLYLYSNIISLNIKKRILNTLKITNCICILLKSIFYKTEY